MSGVRITETDVSTPLYFSNESSRPFPLIHGQEVGPTLLMAKMIAVAYNLDWNSLFDCVVPAESTTKHSTQHKDNT